MFNTIKINENVTLRNRLVVAPMTTWASNDDLSVSDQEVEYYALRSKNAGMVITGCTFFEPHGQGFENEFYAGSDDYIPSLKRLADAIKSGGSKAFCKFFMLAGWGCQVKDTWSVPRLLSPHTMPLACKLILKHPRL